MSRMCALILIILGFPFAGEGQFVLQGNIEFERKVNIARLYESEDAADRARMGLPQFSVNRFVLRFSAGKSIYEPVKESEPPKFGWIAPGADNVVFQDYMSDLVIAAKQVYEQRFFIQDTQRRLKWRMGEEVRTISGFQCRKAVTRICDSVYVVAFYAEEIPVAGGPEQFGGLPGMILELAVPRLHTTWIATKVEVAPVRPEDVMPPTGKAKKVSQRQLMTTLQSSLKSWGRWGSKSIWWYSI